MTRYEELLRQIELEQFEREMDAAHQFAMLMIRIGMRIDAAEIWRIA